MLDPGTLRALALFGPLLLVALLWFLRRPDPLTGVGAWLALAWTLPALFACDQAAQALHLWHYHADGALLLTMPVDLWLGWSILWGPAAALAINPPSRPVPAASPAASPALAWHWATWLAILAAFLLLIDGFLMPALQPLLILEPRWLTGEVVTLIVALLPAQQLARWTAQSTRPAARAFLQALAFGALFLGVFSAAVLEQTGGSFTAWQSRPAAWNSIALQLLALPALFSLSAVQEFAQRGEGTPLPYDPPRHLVTSGLYSFVANPMQIGMTLLLLGWGWFLQSLWLMLAAVVATAFSSGLAAWHEQRQLTARYGWRWQAYRHHVRRWFPRWRPWHPSRLAVSEPQQPADLAAAASSPAIAAAPPARIYLAESCLQCSAFARWLRNRTPVGLEIRPAEEYPTRDLDRATYDPCDGAPEEIGLAAAARAFEHINLAYALAGALMRLPVILPLLQAFADAIGAGPRTIPRRVGATTPATASAPKSPAVPTPADPGSLPQR